VHRGLRIVAVLAAATLAAAPCARAAADALVPPGWAGQWEWTLTYRDRDTGAVVAVDQVVDDICPDQPLGLALLRQVPDCRSTVSGDDVVVDCASRIQVALCTVDAAFHAALHQDADTIAGSGDWSAALSEGCDPDVVDQGQTIAIAAVRRGPALSGRCARPQGLAQAFAVQPGALALSAVPFATLAADLAAGGNGFVVDGTLDLGGGSDGVDPRREEVGLQVGALRLTIPAGSFRLGRVKGSKAIQFTFDGKVGKTHLRLTLAPRDPRRYAFRVEADHARPGTRDVMPFALTIGGDGGVMALRSGPPKVVHSAPSLRGVNPLSPMTEP
jgi:hypothetical protein